MARLSSIWVRRTPPAPRELGEALAAFGITLLGAPVFCGVPCAVQGTLTIMIGDKEVGSIVRAKPPLRAMSDRLFDTGGLGGGHAMKALNNFVGRLCRLCRGTADGTAIRS